MTLDDVKWRSVSPSGACMRTVAYCDASELAAKLTGVLRNTKAQEFARKCAGTCKCAP